MRTLYQIRRKSDGLYSSGGTKPKFIKDGTVYTDRAYLLQHFSQIRESVMKTLGPPRKNRYGYVTTTPKEKELADYVKKVYLGCEIVSYTEVGASADDVDTFLNSLLFAELSA